MNYFRNFLTLYVLVFPLNIFAVTVTVVNDNTHTIIQRVSHLSHRVRHEQTVAHEAVGHYKYTLSSMAGTCAVGIAIAYVLSYSYVVWKSASLSDVQWALWKEEIPLAVLREIPALEIVKELRNTLLAQDAGKNCVPLERALEVELAKLRAFLHMHGLIERYHLSLFFSRNGAEKERAHDYIERLLFLQGCLQKHALPGAVPA